MSSITPDPLPQKAFNDPEEAWAYIARNLPAQHRLHPRAADRAHQGHRAPRAACAPSTPKCRSPRAATARPTAPCPTATSIRPGIYRTTITAPDLFKNYLIEQFAVILRNHGGAIEVGESTTRIPLHFAIPPNERIDGEAINALPIPLRDLFDVPDLAGHRRRDRQRHLRAAARRPLPAGAFHRAARRLFAAPAVALHRHRARAFPELRDLHQLRSSTSTSSAASRCEHMADGHPRLRGVRRARQPRHAQHAARRRHQRRRAPRASRRCRPITSR